MVDLDLLGVLLALVLAGGTGYTVILLINALSRRLGFRERPPALPSDEASRLEARVAELEEMAARLAEVEERVDFVERRLVDAQDPKRIQ